MKERKHWLRKTEQVLMQSADIHNFYIMFFISICSLSVKPWLLTAVNVVVNVVSSQNWKQRCQQDKQIDDWAVEEKISVCLWCYILNMRAL